MPIAVPPANRFTILVVDDEESLRTVLCRALDRIGYTIIQAKNAVRALDLLQNGGASPHLIVSDVEMPHMSGIEMVSRIRSLDLSLCDVPVILASGNSSKEMKSQALEVGANLFLAKPFELAELYAEVGGLLREVQQNIHRDVRRGHHPGAPHAHRLVARRRPPKTV